MGIAIPRVMRTLIILAAIVAVARGEDDGLQHDVEGYLATTRQEPLPLGDHASLMRPSRFRIRAWMLADEETPANANAQPAKDEPAAGAKKRPETELPVSTVEAATLTERPLSETVPAVNLVTREDLDRRMPLGVTEGLHWQPGLWTSQGSSGGSGTPMIRGWQGNQVLLLLDGIRLTNDRTPTGPGPDWEVLESTMVDRVEVLRSPDSVLYGTGAIGGVTALFTRYPLAFTESGAVYGGRTQLMVDSGGLNFWRWRIEGHAATPTVRAVAGTTRFQANDIEAAENVTLHPTEFDTHEEDVRVEWKLDETNVLGFEMVFMRKDWPGNFLHPNRSYDNWQERQMAFVRWINTAETPLYDRLVVTVGAVRNAGRNHRLDATDLRTYIIYTPQATAYFYKGVGSDHALTYGIGTYSDIDDIRRTNSAGAFRGVPNGYVFDLGAFIQDEWQATPKLRVVYGARVDGVKAKTDPDAGSTDPLINPDDIRINQSDFAWTGKVGVLYQASDEFSITGNYSRGYRFPSLSDLAGFRQAPDEIVVGNAATDPEYSDTLEGGLHYMGERWRGSVTGFVSWHQDAIIRTFGTFNGMTFIDRNGNGVEDNDEDIYLTTNAGESRFWGIEAAGEVDVCEQVTIFGNITWWDGTISPDPTEPIGIPFNGTLGVNFHPNQRVYFQFAAHMVGRFDMIPVDFYNAEAFFFKNPQDESEGPLRSDHSIPGYTVFDLRIGVQVTEKATFTAGIDNLFDRQYRRFGDRHDGPGFTVLCGLAMDF